MHYADQTSKPVVVSNSWGSQMGRTTAPATRPTSTTRSFGDSHPNHICLFASSNDGGKSKDGEGGGYHVTENSQQAAILWAPS